MIGALFEALGKVARRLLGQTSEETASPSSEGAPSHSESEAPQTSPPQDPIEKFEADLARDRAELINKRSDYLPKRTALTNIPRPIEPPSSQSEPLDLSSRVPTANNLYEKQGDPSQLSALTERSYLKVSAPVVTLNTVDDDGAPLVVRKVIGHFGDGDADPIPSLDHRESPPKTVIRDLNPHEIVHKSPSATRVKSSSRVVRPHEPEPHTPPLPKGGRVMGVGSGSHPLPSSGEEEEEELFSWSEEVMLTRPPPQVAPPGSSYQDGFQKSASFGLKNASLAHARRSPEQRSAPQLKERPPQVESSAYARFWGAYSANDPSLNFGSLLDFAGAEWAVGLSDAQAEEEGEPKGSTLTPVVMHDPDADWLKLLGGRFGYFGDAMDRQWANKLGPKKDIADFAYQESARFR